MKDLSVLYVEDNPRDAKLIDIALAKHGFDVFSRVVDDRDSILAALDQQVWDIVISDCHLPLITVEEVLKLIQGFDRNIPFIAVSGAISEEDAVDLMKAGAHDFVSKGNLIRLVPAINRELEEAENRRARLLAEYHLKESEERFQLAMKGATDGLWDWNLITNNVYYSERWAEMLGYTVNEIQPTIETYKNLIFPEDRDKVFNEVEAYLKKEIDKFEVEFRMTHKDGSCVNILSRAFYVEGNNRPFRLVGTHVDITSRKQHEWALLQSQQQLRNLSAYLQNVREEEKLRIAKEVHDELGATLTALNFDIHWLQKKLEPSASDVKEKAEDMASLVEKAADSCRRIVTELRPSVLDDLGLLAALEWQANDFSKRNNIPCVVNTNIDDLNLSEEQNIVVFRIFQESLTNVVRHANASRVDVFILKRGNNLTMQVIDDGVGMICPKEVKNSGNDNASSSWPWRDRRGTHRAESSGKLSSNGIRGMKERALGVKGELRIESDLEGEGTRVILNIPLMNEIEVNEQNISC